MNKPWLDETLAANGQPVRENFANWFSASKAVDSAGAPLVVYHGTMRDVEGANFRDATHGPVGMSFFTDDRKTAGIYARGFGRAYCNGSNILPVYLSLQNPKVLDFSDRDDDRDIRGEAYLAAEEGHDGLVVQNAYDGRQSRATQYIAFSPRQIKSAIGNSGLYLKDSPSLDDRAAAEKLIRAKLAQDSLISIAKELAVHP